MSTFFLVHGFLVFIVIDIVAIALIHRYFKQKAVLFRLEDQELDIESRRWSLFADELLRRLEANKKLKSEMSERQNWKKEGF